MNTVLFRADGNQIIATGHVMRCLTIAECVQEHGGNTVFAIGDSTPSLLKRIEDAGCNLHQLNGPLYKKEDADATVQLAQEVGAQWVVIDGYDFDSAYQKHLKDAGLKILVIDDYGHADHNYADIVLNQNCSADEALYEVREPYTELLLGPQYALLRKTFRSTTFNREVPENAENILVTLGGSDPENISSRIMHALASLKAPKEKLIVAGGSSPFIEEQKALAGTLEHTTVETDVSNMCHMMQQADLAIGAGGSTSFEMAFLGLPIITIIFAMNQEQTAIALDKAGASLHLGWAKDIDNATITNAVSALATNKNKRESMSENGRKLVDGQGVERIVMRLRESPVRLRRVIEEDMMMLLEWANDSTVRASAFNTEEISEEDHKKWFAQKITSDTCSIHIALNKKDEPIGQIRFDIINNSEAEIDLHLSADHRGKGYGSALIEEGIGAMQQHGIKTLHAYIKPENEASIRSFEKAGFSNVGSTTYDTHDVIHCTYTYE